MDADIELQRRLAVIWDNEPPDRYVPKSLDGGTSWGVWDRRKTRMVPDEEVRGLSFENVCETYAN
jgi:hypothetical protein